MLINLLINPLINYGARRRARSLARSLTSGHLTVFRFLCEAFADFDSTQQHLVDFPLTSPCIIVRTVDCC